MRRILALFLFAAALAAQFPGTVSNSQYLAVAVNRSSSTLSANIDASTLSIQVGDGTEFTANQIVTIEDERILICSVGGNTLTVCSGGRAYDSSTAAAHTNGTAIRGQITAWHHNVLREEVRAIEVALGANLVNVAQLAAANTYTTGAQDFGAATSLTVPKSAGAAPTVSGRVSYDTTSNTLEAGVNGSNKVVAFTDSNVATATALAANPTDCSANQFATTIAASGNLTCAQPAFSDLSGAATDAQIPNTITVDLATAATALASNPTDCSSNQFANAIAANGNLTCAALVDADIPNTITVDLATAATALAANPADCSAGQYATTIAASGALTCAQVAYSQLSGTSDVVTGGSSLTSTSVIPRVTASGVLGPSKLQCSATPVICILYDDTASTGSSFYKLRAGAGQSTTPFIQFRNNADTDTRFQIAYAGAADQGVTASLKATTGNFAAELDLQSGGGGGSGDHSCVSHVSVSTAKWLTCGIWNGATTYALIDPEDSFATKFSVAKTTGNTYVAGTLLLGHATDTVLTRVGSAAVKLGNASGTYGSWRAGEYVGYKDTGAGYGFRCQGFYNGASAVGCYYDITDSGGARHALIGLSGTSNRTLFIHHDDNEAIAFDTNNTVRGYWTAGGLFQVGGNAAASASDPALKKSSAVMELKLADDSAYTDLKPRAIQYTTGTRPTCDASARGYTWYVAGGGGVADTFEICRKDAGDAYAWVALF